MFWQTADLQHRLNQAGAEWRNFYHEKIEVKEKRIQDLQESLLQQCKDESSSEFSVATDTSSDDSDSGSISSEIASTVTTSNERPLKKRKHE